MYSHFWTTFKKMTTPSLKTVTPATLKNLSTKERYYLHEDNNIIGRKEYALVHIPDKQVSRTHCSIIKNEEGSFSIVDSSCYGTLVNGAKLNKNEAQVLSDQDIITILTLEATYRYEFNVNENELVKKKSEAVSSRFKEQIIDLDTSYTEDMKKLSEIFTGFEMEKGGLKEELNSRLEAQETLFREEKLSLSSMVTTSNEQRLEAERLLKEAEERSDLEKANLMKEIENQINDITKKEMELEETKVSMENRYRTEREELEERCKAEIKELKERLAESEVEQGRLKEETLEVEKELKETKKNLHQSELEQFQLHQEKVAVEKKLESKIINLTQESSTKDEMVKFLEQRLFQKEEEEVKMRKEMEDLEEELQCSICAELFIEPCVLNCGHLFCKSCIDQWKKKKKLCPMCRAKISSCVRMPKMDAIIDKNVLLLSNEAKERRKCTIKERINESCIPAKKRRVRVHLDEPQIVYHQNPHLRTFELNVERPPAIPSTSRLVNHMMQIPVSVDNPLPLDLSEPDPFAWTNRNTSRRRDTTAALGRSSPVTVAAVDLTGMLTMERTLFIPGTRSQNRTSTVAAADTTIDLTSL